MIEVKKIEDNLAEKMAEFQKKAKAVVDFMITIPGLNIEDSLNLHSFFLAEVILEIGKYEEKACLDFFADIVKVIKKNIKNNVKRIKNGEGIENEQKTDE